MRVVIGILFLTLGIGWLLRIAIRGKNKRSPFQVIFDFFTGSPYESIITISLILMGIILILAHFVA